MVTRDQIEEMRRVIGTDEDPRFAETWTAEEGQQWQREFCDLLLRALDTERDAALGRAVRGVVDRGEHTIDVLDGAIVGLVPTLGPEVLRVVLAHLREEQKETP